MTYLVTSCEAPAKTGCRYRFTETERHYWVSNPKRGGPMRAWVRACPAHVNGYWRERWLRCELWEAIEDCAGWYDYDERNPRFSAACRDLSALRKGAA